MIDHIPFPYRNLHPEIDTPALIIRETQLNRNIEAMQAAASANGIRLRPHFKTHKSTGIANRQIIAGAAGITVAKLGEAEVLAGAGIQDIFIANQLTHPAKFHRLREVLRTTRIIIGIDHVDQVSMLEPFFHDASNKLEVRIEIDSGLQRCGVSPGPVLVSLAKHITTKSWLNLEGIFTHAGQVYGATSAEEVKEIAGHEIRIMEEAAALLKQHGFPVETVSVGSTPAIPWYVKSETVNEIRPGNYVFNDGIQCALGVCPASACSLYVLATVISRPDPCRIVIDAGSKSLGLDKGAQSTVLLNSFGTLLNVEGSITRVSEEHGIIETGYPADIRIGEPVVIIPNHACSVANLFEYYYLIDSEHHLQMLPVSARAKSQ